MPNPSTRNATRRRTTTVVVAATLVLAGLVYVAPTAAAGTCQQDPDPFPEVSVGGHQGEDLTHVCLDVDQPPTSVPTINCVACNGLPNVDPTPPTPDPQGPGNPPIPGAPPNDCTTGGLDHPCGVTALDWAVGIVTDFANWAGGADPGCGNNDCTDVTPVVDWAENNAGTLISWSGSAVGIGEQDVATVGIGDTHASDDGAKEESCEAIFGEGTDPSKCYGAVPCDLDNIDQCGIQTSAGVAWDGTGTYTPGLVVESDQGAVFVPVTELA